MSDTVRMRIRGLMPEKLIERAREMDVRFQAIEPRGDHEIVVGVAARDAEKLSDLCRRFSIPCEVLSRRGRSALGIWLKNRWTLLVGLAVMLAACRVFFGHIWQIDVAFIGDSAALGDPEAVYAALDAIGVRPGIPRDLDARLLSEELLARCEGLSNALSRVEGVRLRIELAPEAAKPEVYALNRPRDLYADRTGIVVSVNVEAGLACVRPGDTVRRGQLLIRGEEKRSKEETRPIAALGQVVIRSWFEGQAEGSLTEERTEYTGRVAAASTLITPWLDIPITGGSDFAQQAETVDALPIGGLYLPVSVRRVTRRETRTRRVSVDPSALGGRLCALAMAEARARLCAEGPEQYEITRCWTRVSPASDRTLSARAVCEITTNTAVTIETLRQGG